jgi:cell division initiation protein
VREISACAIYEGDKEMITPVDIETVDFKKVALGYSQDEVDLFLDKVIAEMERRDKEIAKLQDKITVMNDALKYYKDMEDTIKNSIVTAEKNAEGTKHNAEVEASQIIKTAEQQAKEVILDLNKQKYQVEAEIMRAKTQYETVRGKIRILLETELNVLDKYSEELGLSDVAE